MQKHQKVAVIILNYNTPRLTLAAVKPLSGRDGVPIYVLDNGSKSDSLRADLKDYKNVTYEYSNKNLGFPKGLNYFLKKIANRYDYILLLNSDAQISKEALAKLVVQTADKRAAVSSCKLVYPDGSFQPNAGSTPNWRHVLSWLSGVDDIANIFGVRMASYQESKPWFYKHSKAVGWVSGSVMLVDCEWAKKLNYFDDHIFMYGEDVDFCYRAGKAGGLVFWFSDPTAMHIGGASSKDAKYKQWKGEFLGLLYFFHKHYGIWSKRWLRFLYFIFIPLRIVLFVVFGKVTYAQYYYKVLGEI